MKFLLLKYRLISIWLSLFILMMGFVIGSDRESRSACVILAFLAGMFLHGIGALKEWKQSRMTMCLINMLLAVCMLTLTILSILRLGGIL